MEEREKRASRKEGIQNLVERKKEKTLKEGKKERRKKTYRKKKES